MMTEKDLTQEQIAGIKEEIEAENKIEAIKMCREYSGWGLKESKDYVERYIKELIERDPEKYSYLLSSGSSGCFAVIFLMVISTATIVFLV